MRYKLTLIINLMIAMVACEEKTFFANRWSVELHDDLDLEEVDAIAAQFEFVNFGKVFPDEKIYHFFHSRVSEKSENKSHHHQKLLDGHLKIKKSEQEVLIKMSTKSRDSEQSTFYFNDPLWSNTWYLNRESFTGLSHYSRYRDDLNVIGAWRKGYTGVGVVVAVVDCGVEYNHTDLRQNYRGDLSFDVVDGDTYPFPGSDNTTIYGQHVEAHHGTRCAGEITASANNSKCSVGVAYNAQLAGMRLGKSDDNWELTIGMEAQALSYRRDQIDIYSNSWGDLDDGSTVNALQYYELKALDDGVNKGRGGKGNIFVFAAGNGGLNDDDCNLSGFANSPYTITVTAVSEWNAQPYYLETCSATLVAAYSGSNTLERAVYTTDIGNGCSDQHSGTSAATPLASGIIALMLEANPDLGWRDVQHILVRTSRSQPLIGGEFETNAAGFNFSHHFGFGLLDAEAAVDMSLNWKNVMKRVSYSSVSVSLSSWTPDGQYQVSTSQDILVSDCRLTAFSGDCTSIKYTEHVRLKVTVAPYQYRGNLEILLRSPSGTTSKLLHRRSKDLSISGFHGFYFTSVHFWGENPTGNWTVTINDRRGLGQDAYDYSTPDALLEIHGVVYNVLDDGQAVEHACHFLCDEDYGCIGTKPTQCLKCRTNWKGSSVSYDSLHHICYLSNCPDPVQATVCAECSSDCFNQSTSDPPCGKSFYSCSEGYYHNASIDLCQLCNPLCKTCEDGETCTSCKNPCEFAGDYCYPKCKTEKDYLSDNGTCIECTPPDHCSDCVGRNICTVCDLGYFFYNGQCLSKCPHGTSPVNNTLSAECVRCDKSCSSCFGTKPDQCLTSPNTSKLVGSTGVALVSIMVYIGPGIAAIVILVIIISVICVKTSVRSKIKSRYCSKMDDEVNVLENEMTPDATDAMDTMNTVDVPPCPCDPELPEVCI